MGEVTAELRVVRGKQGLGQSEPLGRLSRNADRFRQVGRPTQSRDVESSRILRMKAVATAGLQFLAPAAGTSSP